MVLCFLELHRPNAEHSAALNSVESQLMEILREKNAITAIKLEVNLLLAKLHYATAQFDSVNNA